MPQPAVASGNPVEAIAFYALALAAAGSAFGCVLASNIVRMAMCLLSTLTSVALLYFLMAANFLGVVQIIVYAGGTLIVIIFGVMLTSRAYATQTRPKLLDLVAGAVVCLGLFFGLVTILTRTVWTAAHPDPRNHTVAELGSALLSTYLVPFELASVLLLAVMIGAAYVAQPLAPQDRQERE